jgi:hypothetical protein
MNTQVLLSASTCVETEDSNYVSMGTMQRLLLYLSIRYDMHYGGHVAQQV